MICQEIKKNGATLRRRGKREEAEDFLKQALDFDRQQDNQRNIARTLRQLGMLYLDKNNIQDASDCFNEV